ncbi:MAG: branched-chain-amino acid aminotransferase [Deltaproteobacteria bacterium]|nr:branched-chain-amino acid aminotransferase [Deltaproteobacteria bacterium]
MGMKININKHIYDPEDAAVPVLDRGFLYGDSVYEVLRTYKGRLFAVKRHINRLCNSAARIALKIPDPSEILDQVKITMAAAGNEESYVRIIVTRGTGPITLDPFTAENPLTVILVKRFVEFEKKQYEEGISLLVPNVRRNSRYALDPAIKSGNYLNSILALEEAKSMGYDDALMLDINGRITEATTSNVFIVDENGVLCTPKLQTGILEGVTRGFILDLAERLGLDCLEKDLFPEDLEKAREVMLTSTLREVMSVTRIDGRKIADGRPGPVSKLIREKFRQFAMELIEKESQDKADNDHHGKVD